MIQLVEHLVEHLVELVSLRVNMYKLMNIQAAGPHMLKVLLLEEFSPELIVNLNIKNKITSGRRFSTSPHLDLK